MNFTGPVLRTQALRALWALALVGGCARGYRTAAPASPEAAVRGFLAAVHANSLGGMGDLWGDRRGPARGYMNASELEQRLTVIRSFLQHEQFELLESQAGVLPADGPQRVVQVRLTRRGCTPVVPFTVIRYGSGWLVTHIDLAAAGNPARSCAPRR